MKKFAEAIRSDGVPRKIGKLAIATFVLGVLMSVFAIVSALNVRSELSDAFASVERLRDEQALERALLGNIIDAENGLRGYALSGDEIYLEPFAKARDTIQATNGRYLALRSGPPESYLRFDRSLHESWQKISQAVELKRSATADSAAIVAQIALIKPEVDVLRDEQSALDRVLSEKLARRTLNANEVVSTLLSALGVLALGVVLLSFAQLREMAIQAAAFLRSERSAKDAITGLEQAVAKSRDELEWVNRQLSITLRSAGVQVFTMHANGEIDWVADTQSRIELLNHFPTSLLTLARAQDRDALQAALEEVQTTREECDVEIGLGAPGSPAHWIKIHLAPQTAMVRAQIMGCAFDITDLKQREENNFWLMRELSHRSKNLLAIVQSIARQTGRGALDKQTFLSRFTARVQALAASHDLLVLNDYAGASLADLVRSQLSGIDHLIGARVKISGPEIILRAEAAQNLGMALHELSTNAQIHGAMNQREGALDIAWRIEDATAQTASQTSEGPQAQAGEPMLVLDWLETAKDPVVAAAPAGFGDTLIRVNLPRSLEGQVLLEHAEHGTRCTMRLPVRRLQPDYQKAN